MKKQDQQNKEFEEFYYPDEPDLKMPGDFFEQKLKDEIIPAEEILRDAVENNGCDELCIKGSYWEQILIDAMDKYADQFKKK